MRSCNIRKSSRYAPRVQNAFTRADARAYDEHAMRVLGIPGIELMENAARGCTTEALAMLGAQPKGVVLVYCGPGQNGGDGYAIARLLAARGIAVEVVALGAPKPATDAAEMRLRAERAGIAIRDFAARASAQSACGNAPPALVVDALFGTGLDRALSGDALEAVRAINAHGVPVLAVDLPSGMDCDTGAALPECVHASVTATMAAPKQGFASELGARHAGRVVVVDIIG